VRRKRKQAILVIQHLEGMRGSALDEFPGVVRDFIQGRNGVYALYKGRKLYYVGLASNLRSRLRSHTKDRHAGRWDRFSIYLTEGDEHLRELESLVLRIADPTKGNRATGKFIASEDLSRRFRRKLRDYVKQFDDHDSWRKPPEEEKRPKPKQRDRGSRKATLEGLSDRRFHIRMKHRDKVYIAHVQRDGTITFAGDSAEPRKFAGRVFYSPSQAAVAVVGKARNGWRDWKFRNQAGEWVLLDRLRKGRSVPLS
jgi:hypothetical protein